MQPIHLSPEKLLAFLPNKASYCLFLDIDGTLADFQLNPNEAFVPPRRLALLNELNQHGVEMAFITGRNLAEAQRMLSPLTLPIAATHGLELSMGNPTNDRRSDKVEWLIDVDFSALNAISTYITEQAGRYEDLWVEYKPYSCALHYRGNPALAEVVEAIMLQATANFAHQWALKQGKFVLEALPKGIDKGRAIVHLLEHKFANVGVDKALVVIFIGDDVTDESGFAAIQHGLDRVEAKQPIHDFAIKVGHEPTCAKFYVNNLAEVEALLRQLLIVVERSFRTS